MLIRRHRHPPTEKHTGRAKRYAPQTDGEQPRSQQVTKFAQNALAESCGEDDQEGNDERDCEVMNHTQKDKWRHDAIPNDVLFREECWADFADGDNINGVAMCVSCNGCVSRRYKSEFPYKISLSLLITPDISS
ncbi:MAG: hypothetical protein RB191_24060 [Terriglobia bacterium]|nr:hypothetical protein [Terriglobia bacterium]